VSTPDFQYGVMAASGAIGSLVSTALLLPSRRGQKSLVRVGLDALVNMFAGAFAAAVLSPANVSLALFAGFLVPWALPNLLTKKPFEDNKVEELQRNVKEAEEAVQKEPEKAQPKWDLSRAQLDLYIARNLAQVRQIFFITVAVMGAGFAMVAWGVYRALDGQIQIAVLTAVSGVVTQTIGATFLFIYRSTIRQSERLCWYA
jgi:hypothetical protein